MGRMITQEAVDGFERQLFLEEKALLTVKKYIRDVRRFREFLGTGGEVTKEEVIRYKGYLKENYRASSANSMLAALNLFLRFMGWDEMRVKQFKVQRVFFCQKERYLSREEYKRLVQAAVEKGDEPLELIMQTLCSTGLRIGELKFVTVEAVRAGETRIVNKGKERFLPLPKPLIRLLKGYIRRRGIASGPVFITGKGEAVSRVAVWKKMKRLCKTAQVAKQKVFPHNLRHLFAYTFYQAKRDLLYLAEIMGHTSIETTRIYTRTPGQEYRKWISGLGLVCKEERKGEHNLNYVPDMNTDRRKHNLNYVAAYP